MIKNNKHKLWVEKYRPQVIDDFVFQDEAQKSYFKNIITSNEIPNLLLYGNAGTGKSSLSKILLKEMNVEKADILRVNCSDEKIDAIREKVSTFSKALPFGKYKIVQLEEFDYSSLDAQALLRSLIEDTSSNCRFIATCNYFNKIIQPLKSRFVCVKLDKPSIDDVIFRMISILTEENIQYDDDDLINFIQCNYPDLRAIVQALQKNISNNVLLSAKQDEVSNDDWRYKLLECLKMNNISMAREIVCKNTSKEEHETVYRFLYDNINQFKESSRDQIVVIIADHLYRNSIVADTEINLASCFIQIKQELNNG